MWRKWCMQGIGGLEGFREFRRFSSSVVLNLLNSLNLLNLSKEGEIYAIFHTLFFGEKIWRSPKSSFTKSFGMFTQ